MPTTSDGEEVIALSCPFCGHNAENEYGILYHLESTHPEGEFGSPFLIKEEPNLPNLTSASEDVQDEEYIQCSINGCGEVIHLSELGSHFELHSVESEAEAIVYSEERYQSKDTKLDSPSQVLDTGISHAIRRRGDDKPSQELSPVRLARGKVGWKELLNMSGETIQSRILLPSKISHKRLGTSELGPHANEKQMPLWLRKLLQSDGEMKVLTSSHVTGVVELVQPKNYALGILPVVEQLLQQDPSTEYAYTCHPCVQHVSKLKNEGGFCGYRNIQMLLSFIVSTQSQGYCHFDGNIPGILQIQELIEHAWDIGINKQGRLETGGIRGTRKYIGTPEAQAMFCSLDIACDAQGLKSNANHRADHLLFQSVEQYFASGSTKSTEKVRNTVLPPIYFQHPGHSMTIVGMEKKKNGDLNLIVFDPMFHDSTSVTNLVGHKLSHRSPADLLRAYRRGTKYLKKYSEFEILRLTPPANIKASITQ